MNSLCGQAQGAWTYHEDRTIWLAGSAPGPTKWAKLSREMGTRNDNQCLQRFRCLKKYTNTLKTQAVCGSFDLVLSFVKKWK